MASDDMIDGCCDAAAAAAANDDDVLPTDNICVSMIRGHACIKHV
jgi:hypothetical protein